jgi:hypothetical protein
VARCQGECREDVAAQARNGRWRLIEGSWAAPVSNRDIYCLFRHARACSDRAGKAQRCRRFV